MKTYKITSQKDLEKFKDDYGYKIDGNAEFSYTAIFDGRLDVEGYLVTEAGSYIKAGSWIEAGYSIEAGDFIKAGSWIKAGDSYGIQAGLNITCKGTLSFGLKAFAGISTWREISEEEKTITCSKMIGGGVVEYGTLVETGEEIEKMIELSNGKKVSESTIIEALRALTE